MNLLDARNEVADRIFDDFDFIGEEIVDADGWETVTPGTEMSRKVYLADDSGTSLAGHMTIVFDGVDSTTPVEAYAMLNGDLIGSMTTEQLARYSEPAANDLAR